MANQQESERLIVAGLDLSLTATGVAILDIDKTVASTIETIGSAGKNADRLPSRLARINKQAKQIVSTVTEAGATFVAVEAPAFSSSTGKAHDRAGLWWDVVRRLESSGVAICEINVSAVKMYATGKGNASKSEVMLAVARRYPHVPFANDNETDAFTLACIAARISGRPIEGSLPQVNLRAMEKVRYEAD